MWAAENGSKENKRNERKPSWRNGSETTEYKLSDDVTIELGAKKLMNVSREAVK